MPFKCSGKLFTPLIVSSLQQVCNTVPVEKLTPSEIVETFPDAKKVVKALLKECEEFLDEVKRVENETKEFLSNRVPMMDINIASKLVLAAMYGGDIEKTLATKSRLTRLLYIYDAKKGFTPGRITHTDIARAKEVPIAALVDVKANTTRCLWHEDRHPSMHIYKKDNAGFCFSCGQRSDSIDFAIRVQGIPFIEAVQWLNKL